MANTLAVDSTESYDSPVFVYLISYSSCPTPPAPSSVPSSLLTLLTAASSGERARFPFTALTVDFGGVPMLRQSD